MISRFYTTGHKTQRASTTLDSYGDPVQTWTDKLTVSGKLWHLSGDERLSADKLTYYADAKFATALADIIETDRFVSGGATYKIKAVARRTRPDGTGHMELDLELVR